MILTVYRSANQPLPPPSQRQTNHGWGKSNTVLVEAKWRQSSNLADFKEILEACPLVRPFLPWQVPELV